MAEFKANGLEFRRSVQVKLRSSYSHHYRVGMVELLRTLPFRSNNTTRQPIIDGSALVLRHADNRFQCFPKEETVPLAGIVEGDWLELAYRGEPATSRGAHRLRGVPVPGAAGTVAVQGDLGRGRGPVA